MPTQFKEVYLDEYTREPLPTHLVCDAIIDELNHVNAKVWELTNENDVKRIDGAKTVPTRRVLCNKGDNVNFDIRARLFACELKQYRKDEFYASTPPFAGASSSNG